jgi:uncharacterized protein (DUF3084 family)
MPWDPQSLIFILVMALLSGLAAFVGDRIGTRVGKRRISILGLRPKNTAAVLAALFGFLVTLAGVAVLFFVSSNVRYFIEKGDRARVELQKTQGELEGLKKSLDASRADLDKQNRALAEASGRLEKAAASEKALKAEQGRLVADSGRLREEAARLRSEAEELRSSAERSRAGLARTQGQLSEANKSLSATRGQIASLTSQIEGLEARRTELETNNSQFQRENQTIQERNLSLTNDVARKEEEIAELNKSIDGLKTAIRELEEAREGQEAALRAARTDLEAAERDRDAATATLAGLRGELDTAETRLADLSLRLRQSFASRELPLILNIRDEVARVSAPPRLNAAEARRLLLAALGKADEYAQSRGAQPPRGAETSVSFADRMVQGRLIPAEEQGARVLQLLSGGQEERLLVVNALYNIFQGEGVPITASIFPNPVVYRAGDVVAEARIDGRQSESEIADAIGAFVGRDLRQAALQRGMIPAFGRPASLGEMAQPVLLKLVSDLQAQGRPARVQFISRLEARAGDRIELEYVIR